MADYNILIPFILNAETSVPYMTPVRSMYEMAAHRGASSHPADKGGLTLCGVTTATFRDYCRLRKLPADTPLTSMTFERWTDLYRTMFWDRCRGDTICSDPVAAAIVDWTWTSGVNAIRRLQRGLHLTADGVFGPVTLRAVNAYGDGRQLLQAICDMRIRYHAEIAPEGSPRRVFLKGWNNRVRRLADYLSNIQTIKPYQAT